ncbi:hypothetical protein JCM14076_23600 [Methylosoma difficile]
MNKVNFPKKSALHSEESECADSVNTKSLRFAWRLRALSLAIVIVTTGMMAGGPQTAWADTPPLSLTLKGPEIVQSGKPIDTVEVRLVNPGKETADSRLRLFIHDKDDREIQASDINIDIREKKGWRQLSVEIIDGGVMAAIGEEGDTDNEHHKKGGFPINKNATQVWQIRLTFRLPGQYTLVVAVSPNNGSTHLAKPASMKIEAL